MLPIPSSFQFLTLDAYKGVSLNSYIQATTPVIIPVFYPCDVQGGGLNCDFQATAPVVTHSLSFTRGIFLELKADIAGSQSTAQIKSAVFLLAEWINNTSPLPFFMVRTYFAQSGRW